MQLALQHICDSPSARGQKGSCKPGSDESTALPKNNPARRYLRWSNAPAWLSVTLRESPLTGKKRTPAFLEKLNSVFSAIKQKARGIRLTGNLIAILYFSAGKLRIPATH